jgi:D-3-phosphoglycerate dehydrogenase
MKILFIDTCHPFLINSLRSDGHECIEGYKLSYEEVISLIKDIEGIVIRSRFKLDKKFLGEAARLKFT